jgi:hypothetical protein
VTTTRTYNGRNINMTEAQAAEHDFVLIARQRLVQAIRDAGGRVPDTARDPNSPLRAAENRPFESALRAVAPNSPLLGGGSSLGGAVGPLSPLPSLGQGTMTQAEYQAFSAANRAYNGTGQTQAARAWDKHDTSRPGGTYPVATGNQAAKNVNAENFVRNTMNHPSVVVTNLPRGGTQYRLPNGQGFRIEPNGNFNLLDPRNY